MEKIYIGQKLIILLHFWEKKGVSEKSFDTALLHPPKVERDYRWVKIANYPLSVLHKSSTTVVKTQLYADENVTAKYWRTQYADLV